MTTPADLTALAAHCLDLLRAAGQPVATAESLTAGLVAATIADVPGASDALRGGIVAYATDVKTGVLGVDPDLVSRHGVVSAPCAEAMALRAREVVGSTFGLSTTGVAGPDPQDGQPVGRVFAAVAGPDAAGEVVVHVDELALDGDRADIRRATVAAVLSRLAAHLEQT